MAEVSKDDRARMVSRCAAYALGAAILLVPANLLPVMEYTSAGDPSFPSSILRGVEELYLEGLFGLAAIVFTASILVPGLKLLGIGWLICGAYWGKGSHSKGSSRLYGLLDFIGRWSMLDVFVVAFLTGGVQFGQLATVEPREGILAFALAVVLTILATRSFDPRYLWIERKAMKEQA